MRDEATYVLRVWRDGDGDGAWRASLEDLRTRRRHLFDGLESLHAFLDERTARGLGTPPSSES